MLRGWSSSNYGLSKLALIAYTRLLAREEPGIQVPLGILARRQLVGT